MSNIDSKGNGMRVAVGMSGGVDSSAAAALLADQGCEVIGLTAHMWKDGSRCCSLEDVERARKVCAYLGIRHYVVNAQEVFTTKIVDPFVTEYASGRTPSPCIACNAFVKFGFLLERTLQLGCSHLATGHYARIAERDDGFHLLCADDPQKDQSYFLHRLNQRQLSHILFPLSDMKKEAVKAYSNERGLPIIPRGESQDLCFVEDGQYPQFVEQRAPAVKQDGDILTSEGKKVGGHTGIHRFTIGQRGGLGVATGERMYVKRLDSCGNRVEIGRRDELMGKQCSVKGVHWISGKVPAESFECEVRPRYRSNGSSACVTCDESNGADVVFSEPQFALTPGQAAVFYKDGEVLGGGWIDEVP